MRSSSSVVMIPAILIWIVVAAAATEVQAAKRVALVIGNSAYQHTRVLPNPKNDATAIAEALRRIGFDKVTLKLDQDYTSLRRTLRDFGSAVEGADVAIVYYAGHGMELGGQNYLVPTDAKLVSDRDLEFEAVKLSTILHQVKPARQLRLVILDACRNNPLGSTMTLSQGVSRSVSRGLSRIEPGGDVLVAYAAKHGTVASDGNGKHSPYTAALLKHLETPGLDVGFMFRRVRSDVLAATTRVQEPFTYGSLGRESVYLVPPTASTSAKAAPAPSPIGQSAAAEAWNIIKDTESADDLQVFIKRFADSFYADLARSRLKKLQERKVAVGVFPKTPTQTVGRKLVPGEEFQDCPECPKMVVVPAGSFMMGSSKGEKGRNDGEGPQRRVTIPRLFAVGKFEVTVDQFTAFVRDTSYDAGSKCKVYNTSKKALEHWSGKKASKHWSGKSFRVPGFTQTGSHPAACLNWHDAKAYVAWLSRKTGKTYRLLSEAEWEYAARARTTTQFHFGNSEADLCIYANAADLSTYFDWRNQSCSDGIGATTAKVGSYKSNVFGLHDMHGNLWEWTEDCWNKTYTGAPNDGSSRKNGDCSRRVLRGGSWYNISNQVRSAFRIKAATDYRASTIGLRVARTLAP